MQIERPYRHAHHSNPRDPSARWRRAAAASPTRRISFLVCAAAVSAALIAGCGGGSGGDSGNPGVASIGSSSSSSTTPSSQSSSSKGGIPTEGHRGNGGDRLHLQEAFAYAKCLRANGLPKYPDPEEQHGGLLLYVPFPNTGSGLSLHDPQVLAADKACAEERGAVFGPPSAEELERIKTEALESAECMRSHGIDEPDPVVDSEGVLAPPPKSVYKLPGYNAAAKACAD